MNGCFKLQLDGWAIGMFFCGWNVGGRLCNHADANKEPSWSRKNKGAHFDADGAKKIQAELLALGFKTTIVDS